MANRSYFQIAITAMTFAAVTGLSPSAQLSETENLRSAPTISYSKRATKPATTKLTEAYFASKLDTSGIAIHPGSRHSAEDSPTPIRTRKCKSIVYQTLASLPKDHSQTLTDLTLFYDKKGRRGLGGGNSIILRCLNVTDAELASVLVHEMGHLVDGSYLTGSQLADNSAFKDFGTPVKADDLSAKFYAISWLDESTEKKDSSKFDFVSLYAMTDPFEDFAETYNFYRLHGAEFRAMAETNDGLNQKYAFMKNYVFDKKEWGADSDDETNVHISPNLSERNYDVTVLPYSLKEFFTN